MWASVEDTGESSPTPPSLILLKDVRATFCARPIQAPQLELGSTSEPIPPLGECHERKATNDVSTNFEDDEEVGTVRRSKRIYEAKKYVEDQAEEEEVLN